MATVIRGNGRRITADQDRIYISNAFRGAEGVIKGIGDECEIIRADRILTVKSGMMIKQGVQILFDGTDKITLPAPTETHMNCRIYVEIDMGGTTVEGKQGIATIKHIDSTTSVPSIPTSDNLTKNPQGKIYLNLGSVGYSTVGGGISNFPKKIDVNGKVKFDEIDYIQANQIWSSLNYMNMKYCCEYRETSDGQVDTIEWDTDDNLGGLGKPNNHHKANFIYIYFNANIVDGNYGFFMPLIFWESNMSQSYYMFTGIYNKEVGQFKIDIRKNHTHKVEFYNMNGQFITEFKNYKYILMELGE